MPINDNSSFPQAPGPAHGVLLEVPHGLGVPSKTARDPFEILAKRKREYAAEGPQWFSPIAYFLGPYEEPGCVRGAAELFRKTNLYGNPPQIYLTATTVGLGIVPTSNWLMRLFRGTQGVLWIPYADVRSIEFHPAIVARMAVMVPATSSRLGQIQIKTKDGRTAKLSGTTVDGLFSFLQGLGASEAGPTGV